MKRLYLAALVLALSCSNPAAIPSLCACTRAEPAVQLRTTLVTAAGAPQSGMRVRALKSRLPCAEINTEGGAAPVTNSSGTVWLMVGGMPNDSICVRFVVREDVAGARERELPGVFRVRTSLPYEVVTVPPLVMPP